MKLFLREIYPDYRTDIVSWQWVLCTILRGGLDVCFKLVVMVLNKIR